MARVRAQIEHMLSQTGAVDVAAHQGRVTLSGSIATHEAEKLLSAVASVAGVTAVVNHLEVNHATASAAGGRHNNATRAGDSWVSAFRRSSLAVAGPSGLQCHLTSVSSLSAFHSLNTR